MCVCVCAVSVVVVSRVRAGANRGRGASRLAEKLGSPGTFLPSFTHLICRPYLHFPDTPTLHHTQQHLFSPAWVYFAFADYQAATQACTTTTFVQIISLVGIHENENQI